MAGTRLSVSTSSRFSQATVAPEAAPEAPVVQAPEVVPMAVPKVLEVSTAHEVAKELPAADPPQLA